MNLRPRNHLSIMIAAWAALIALAGCFGATAEEVSVPGPTAWQQAQALARSAPFLTPAAALEAMTVQP